MFDVWWLMVDLLLLDVLWLIYLFVVGKEGGLLLHVFEKRIFAYFFGWLAFDG